MTFFYDIGERTFWQTNNSCNGSLSNYTINCFYTVLFICDFSGVYEIVGIQLNGFNHIFCIIGGVNSLFVFFIRSKHSYNWNTNEIDIQLEFV